MIATRRLTSHRILVIDDNEEIHKDFEKILAAEVHSGLDELEDTLFDNPTAEDAPRTEFEMDSAYQGLDGLTKVENAHADNRPYAMAFVDMRMPPGWDGLETIAQIWRVDPEIQIVICTAYSDYTWESMIERLGNTDKLLILKKPFDNIEVQQLVAALTVKWDLAKQAKLRMNQLEDMVAERTRELEKANEHKSRFLSAMSHELRTPLNGILGFTDLLMQQYFGALNEKQMSFAERIDECGKHMLGLVDQILDLVKFDAGAMTLNRTQFSPKNLIAASCRMLELQIQKKNLRIHIDTDLHLSTVTGDEKKCQQILLNLLSNAVKYSPENGEIHVTVEKGKQNETRFSVTDTGAGIQQDDQSRIFTEFHQVNRTRDEHLGGIGIGLALTRRLVHLHGGKIGVNSEVGKGSTFWFTLPAVDAATRSQSSSHTILETDRSPQQARRILVVEDNEINLTALLEMLSTRNIDTAVAKNGQQALDLAPQYRPQLILMDLRMPVMDGFEATRRLRAMPEMADIPIVALTASADQTSLEKCREAGCTSHLVKPIQSQELFAALGKYLSFDKDEKFKR